MKRNNEKSGNSIMLILGLIFAAIFIIIGINLIPMENTNGGTGLIGVILTVFTALIVFEVVKAMSTNTTDDDTEHTPSKIATYIKNHKKYSLWVGIGGFLLILLWLVQYLP